MARRFALHGRGSRWAVYDRLTGCIIEHCRSRHQAKAAVRFYVENPGAAVPYTDWRAA